MKRIARTALDVFRSPIFQVVKLAVWVILTPFAVMTSLKESISFLTLISVLALVESASTDVIEAFTRKQIPRTDD